MAESPPPVPLNYQAPGPAIHSGFISPIQRTIFGVLLPNALLALGYFLIFSVLTDGEDGAGWGLALLLFLCMPIVVLVSAWLTAFVVPQRCRRRLFAFFVGSVVPAVVLVIEVIFIKAALASVHGH